MIRAIAIDDEPNALGIIREYARDVSDLSLQETFTDPLRAEAFLQENTETDLVFLDIQMARLNGIELLRRMQPRQAQIVVTTAYPDYALQGFDLDVADYLLKPFGPERFRHALEKVRQKALAANTSTEANACPHQRGPEFIFVRSDYRILKVRVDDILYLEGTGNYVSIHTAGGRILSLQNMRSLEKELGGWGFYRIHKSYIVSVRHIDSIARKSVVVAGQELPVGDAHREAFIDDMTRQYRLI